MFSLDPSNHFIKKVLPAKIPASGEMVNFLVFVHIFHRFHAGSTDIKKHIKILLILIKIICFECVYNTVILSPVDLVVCLSFFV